MVDLYFEFPDCQSRLRFGKEKKIQMAENLRMGDGNETGLSSPFCQEMLSGFFFFLIYAITKENCSKGRAKVQTYSEISSQEYAGKLAPKPTSLPGLLSYARWLHAFASLLNFHMKGITTLSYGTLK